MVGIENKVSSWVSKSCFVSTTAGWKVPLKPGLGGVNRDAPSLDKEGQTMLESMKGLELDITQLIAYVVVKEFLSVLDPKKFLSTAQDKVPLSKLLSTDAAKPSKDVSPSSKDSLIVIEEREGKKAPVPAIIEAIVQKIKDERLEVVMAKAAMERVLTMKMPAPKLISRHTEGDNFSKAGPSKEKRRPKDSSSMSTEDRLLKEQTKKRRMDFSSLSTQAIHAMDPRDLPFICGNQERGLILLNTTKNLGH